MRFVFALLVVLLLLFLFVLARNQQDFLARRLQCNWEASPEFCEQSGIGGAFLCVGPRTEQGFRSYLLMFNEDVILHAQILFLQFDASSPNALLGKVAPVEGTLLITPGDIRVENTLPVEDLMPLQLQFLLDPVKGTLEWLDDETSYLRAFAKPSE